MVAKISRKDKKLDKEFKKELKHEYEKILMDNNIHPYTPEQIMITEFVDKLIGMINE